jgi:hypothetical protein
MTEPRDAQNHVYWHPLLVLVLERFLPAGWQLLPELLLGRLPQRIDIVVLRLIDKPASPPERLHSIFDHLRPHTLIEHKGPTDDLAGADAIVLLGYAMQYMVLNNLEDPGQLCLMVICDRIQPSFPAQINRFGGRFEPSSGGLWRGTVCGMTLHGVETSTACAGAPTERLLYPFARAFGKDPFALIPVDAEEAQVYAALQDEIARIRRTKGAMATKEIEAAELSIDAVLKRMLQNVPPEKRAEYLEALAPEPEQRLAGLAPEQRLAGLGLQQILDGLSPEMRAAFAEKFQH